MTLRENLNKIYVLLSEDEILMRLLYYVPSNAQDKPLDLLKDDILLSNDRWEITENVLMPTDKKYDLDYKKHKICRLCFYTGTRTPLDAYANGRRIDNYKASEQKYNFDVYVHVDIDNTDGRLTDICDRLNELLHEQCITDVGKFSFDFGSPVVNTPDGFIAYKLVYKTPSLQESRVRKWER